MERRPLSPIAKHALTTFQQQAQAEFGRLVSMAAASEGIRPEDGWQFDSERAEWVRPQPDAT